MSVSQSNPSNIQLPERTPTAFLLFCHIPAREPLRPQTLRELIGHWILNSVDNPMRDILHPFSQLPFVEVYAQPVKELSPVLMPSLKPRLDHDEQQKLAHANTCITVRSECPVVMSEHAILGCVAGALACKAQFGGLIIDADTGCSFQSGSPFSEIHRRGQIYISYFLRVRPLTGSDQLGILETQGMGRFGLPELRIENIPMVDNEGLVRVLIGICQVLMSMVTRQFDTEGNFISSIQLPLELLLTQEYLQLSRGLDPSKASDGTGNDARVRLELKASSGQQGYQSAIILPPIGFTGSHGEWLHQLVNTFFATEQTVLDGVVDEDKVKQAHLKARNEIPKIKARFQQGLAQNHGLLVKHAFPLSNGNGFEYMWVFIRSWVGNNLQGELTNVPNLRKDLHAGQTILLTEADIFDWLLLTPDGPIDGGYTDQMVRQHGGHAMSSPRPISRDLEKFYTHQTEIKRSYRQETHRHFQKRYPFTRWIYRIRWGIIIGAVSIALSQASVVLTFIGFGILLVLGLRGILIEQGMEDLRKTCVELGEGGEFVIAYLVMANRMLFSPGHSDAPCLALISFDRRSDDHTVLPMLAHQLMTLKGTSPTEPDLHEAAEFVNNKRHVPSRRRRIPASMAGDRKVYAVDLYIQRRNLSNGFLQEPVLPCLAIPGGHGDIQLISWEVLREAERSSEL